MAEPKVAILAGGCFWCMVMPFDGKEGVLSIRSGYTGGAVENPTYPQVKAQTTGHVEAVKIEYDPDRISFSELLDVFWRQIDPTDDGGQFGDRGSSYRTAIFYFDEEQRQAAEASRAAMEASGKFAGPIVTPILPAAPFYEAEEYHQDYAKKEPEKYADDFAVKQRKAFLHELWDEA